MTKIEDYPEASFREVLPIGSASRPGREFCNFCIRWLTPQQPAGSARFCRSKFQTIGLCSYLRFGYCNFGIYL